MSNDTIVRVDPPMSGPEKEMLQAFLDYHRATLLQKVSGVSEEDAKRQVFASSSLSLLGLVKHLAYVERSWFQRWFKGEDNLTWPWTKEDPDADFRIEPGETIESVVALYQTEVEKSRQLVEAASLDDLTVRPHTEGLDLTLRWIMLHMIEEVARHNGHADLLREAIDGVTGE